MQKLQASFSKKQPITGQEYSSKGYSATIEVELPDGLSYEQLQERIHNTFALVEASVEAELQNGANTVASPAPAAPVQKQMQQVMPIQKASAISPKQLKYVNDLLRDRNFDPSQFLQQAGLNSVYELSKAQSSQLIDLIKGQQKAA